MLLNYYQIAELLVERLQFQGSNLVSVDILAETLRELDLGEETIRLKTDRMEEIERENKNDSEHLEIAEKQVSDFRTKAAVTFGFSAGNLY